jgi:Putative exonuclease SbcCD, C subunit
MKPMTSYPLTDGTDMNIHGVGAAAPSGQLLLTSDRPPEAGDPSRFTRRWRLTGAGLCNVWRYGDLELPAPTGRLLMRGANGTGKTTALEALCPYLLDLNALLLPAGKSRPTTLASIMREGSNGKRRTGYAWLTFAAPAKQVDDTLAGAPEHSWGVRLQYGPNASPPVKLVPFTIPGRPLHDLQLYRGAAREALSIEEFIAAVTGCGGQIFESPEDYVDDLAARVWRARPSAVSDLTTKLRQVRNPNLLGDVSPGAAAEALRASLPGVDERDIEDTAKALAASDTTREACERDRDNAKMITEFASTWTGHVADVVERASDLAETARLDLEAAQSSVTAHTRAVVKAEKLAKEALQAEDDNKVELRRMSARVQALLDSDAYRAHTELNDLEVARDARRENAETTRGQLGEAAMARASAGKSLLSRLTNLAGDLEAQATHAAAAGAPVVPPPLTVTTRLRGVFTVDDQSFDPGPCLHVTGTPESIVDLTRAWDETAADHVRTKDQAQLAIGDHARSVAALTGAAQEATAAAESMRIHHEGLAQKASQRTRTAQGFVDAVLAAAGRWVAAEPGQLFESAAGTVTPGAPDGPSGDHIVWGREDLEVLGRCEPAQVLADLDVWATHATNRASAVAASKHAAAEAAEERAGRLTEDARALREESAALRDGKLLPLPRPAWAGPGDDSRALAAALDWAPGFDDAHARARIEQALGDVGLLGATLDKAGASTTAWRVAAVGAVAASNLTSVLGVDPDQPGAADARAVMERIALHDSATGPDPATIVIGRDGSFRAGPLHGNPFAAEPGKAEQPASYVGAGQRLRAAMEHADVLDAQADQIELQAAALQEQARTDRTAAAAAWSRARTFPDRDELRRSESMRAGAQAEADEAKLQRDALDRSAADARVLAQRSRREWVERTRAAGLEPDLDVLTMVVERALEHSQALAKAAGTVRGTLVRDVTSALNDLRFEEDEAAKLPTLQNLARAAHMNATGMAERVRTLRERLGADINQARDKVDKAQSTLDDLQAEVDPLGAATRDAAEKMATKRTELKGCQERVQERQQPATWAATQLRDLLQAPGVVLALAPTEPLDERLPADAADLAALARTLTGAHKAVHRRAVADVYQRARAQLAGTWSLDQGDSFGDLDTFVFAHTDASYSPAAAAARANQIAAAAEEELSASEERALDKFVVLRLPAGLGTAWHALLDWRSTVNEKMKTAAASSGVGVQVKIEPALNEMSAAVRTVYDLACRSDAADRTPEQKAQLGKALQSLISAAEGDTMLEKVTAAVNLRDWVHVTYVVTRPGLDPQAWTSRTGLSGGERRLVVLAPMLAAIAATYDSLDPAGLRVATLDEVPAEVDEGGMQGLARYIAELDLDMVCTSFTWDGSPGAWDGIDSWDFEGDGSGTVVAFPSLVRGEYGLPGDAAYIDAAGYVAAGSDQTAVEGVDG